MAMATFGAMWAALSATAPRLARDREGGWSDYLVSTPLGPATSRRAGSSPGCSSPFPPWRRSCITAVVAHGVHLAAWQWAADVGLLWIGDAAVRGPRDRHRVAGPQHRGLAVSTGLWFAFAALGGLWVPPGVLSPGLRHLAAALPSYNQAALGWHVTSGSAPTAANVLVLAAWTVGLSLLPLLARSWPGGPGAAPSPPSAKRRGQRAAAGPSNWPAWSSTTARSPPWTASDLRIPPGETVALLGPNGAGKTTTMSDPARPLAGRQRPASPVRLLSPAAAARGEVGAMLQDAS